MLGLTVADVAMYAAIENAGLTVTEVYMLYRQGTLPEPLKTEMQQYEARLKVRPLDAV